MNSQKEDHQSAAIRKAAFDWLKTITDFQRDVLPRILLEQGFQCGDLLVKLIGPQGIFKPAQIAYYPLSITTTTRGPYKDTFAPEGDLLLYRYRGADPNFHENCRLRDAMRDRIPLIYFHGTVPGHYLAVWPVYVVGDNPGQLTFTVSVDDPIQLSYERNDVDDTIRRGYITRQTRQRIHQRTFRDRVLAAYQSQCTVCRLKHPSMLDAAHIIPDADPEGDPIVNNGLSLCKLHHAAYDQSIFGIRPDYSIEVREDILEESDGPMLKHGLQEIHDSLIQLPSRKPDRPDPARLERRYDEFRSQ